MAIRLPSDSGLSVQIPSLRLISRVTLVKLLHIFVPQVFFCLFFLFFYFFCASVLTFHILTLSPSNSRIIICNLCVFLSFHFSFAIYYVPLLLSLCAFKIYINSIILYVIIYIFLFTSNDMFLTFNNLMFVADYSFSLLCSIPLSDYTKTHLSILICMLILSFYNLRSNNAINIFYESLETHAQEFSKVLI